MSELNPAPRRLPADLDYLSSIDEIIEDAREGRMFVLVDDQDRENEGDLVIPAQMATPEAINFMATHGRGLICLSLTQERVSELGLTPMERRNSSRFETAFMVSIEAKEGVTTGISAPDRAHTIQIAIDPAAPSHVYCSDYHGEVYSSYDSGSTWSKSRVPAETSRARHVYPMVCG